MRTGPIPTHVAIIMDGNNRWASQHRRAKLSGHRAGADALRKVIQQCVTRGIETLSVFAFSSENWNRPQFEVDGLMRLFERSLLDETPALVENGVRLRVIGDRAGFSLRLKEAMAFAEAATEAENRLTLNVLANYGGRWHLTEAVRQTAQSVAAGELDLKDLDESWLSTHSPLADCPDVDLLIRTGGECRLSNFLLWQAAYAELIFSPVLWPDFDGLAFDACLAEFAARERRFGQTSEQIQEARC